MFGTRGIKKKDIVNKWCHKNGIMVLLMLLLLLILSACSGSSNSTGSTGSTGSTDSDITAPSVPRDVLANSSGSTSIQLTWLASTDVVGVTGYKIFRDGVYLATALTLSYEDSQLNSGTVYSYIVLAFDAAGNESAQSQAVSVDTGNVSDETITTLTVKETSGTQRNNAGVRTGIPFSKGSVAETDTLKLKDGAQVLDLQKKVLSKWDDGSVRWMLLDTQLSISPDATKELTLIKSQETINSDSELTITESSQMITIDTGIIMVEVPKTNGSLIHRLWRGDTLVLDAPDDEATDRGPWISSGGETFYGQLIKQDSQILPSDPVLKYKNYVDDYEGGFNQYDLWDLSVTIEEQGPVHAVIRVSGAHLNASGMGFCSFVTRIHAYAGKANLRFDHTLIFTRTGNDTVQGYGIRIPFEGSTTTIEGVEATTGSLVQSSRENYSLAGVDHSGQAKGYMVRANSNVSLGIVLQDMAENYPKAMVATTSGLDVQLYPEAVSAFDSTRYSQSIDTANGEGGDTKNRAAQGFSKTDTLIMTFQPVAGGVSETTTLSAQMDSEPMMLLASPDWYSETRVMGIGDFVFNTDLNNSESLFRIDRKLKVIADFMRYNQRIQYDWFGMMDYGDIRGLFKGGCAPGSSADCTWSELGRYGWSGNSGEPANQLWVQYLRTQEPDVLTDAIALSKHTQDVQMIHYGDATEFGDESISGGRNREFSVGSLHRHGRQAFSGYGQAPEYSHVAGVETYYYLTGDGRAKESLYEAASFIHRYGPSEPSYTALVNGIDVLSRVSAVFFDEMDIYNRFNDRTTVLINSLVSNGVTDELDGSSLGGAFGYFVRGAGGLLYHHERTGNADTAALIFDAANYISGGGDGDRWGVGDDGETGSVWYFLNSLTYAAEIADSYGRSGATWRQLVRQVIINNTHAVQGPGTGAISLSSFQAVPDDWTQWVWEWHEGDLDADEPELLYITRQMTFRNNYMQDYHSYRSFIHLAVAAALFDDQ